MLQIRLRMIARRGEQTRLLAALRSMLERTRMLPGCCCFHLSQDVENRNLLTVVEEWETEADLVRHLRSEDYRRLMQIAEMSAKPPEIEFNFVSATRGIAAIEAIRAEKQSVRPLDA